MTDHLAYNNKRLNAQYYADYFASLLFSCYMCRIFLYGRLTVYSKKICIGYKYKEN